MLIIPQIARSVKSLFTSLADRAAATSKVILRKRKLTPQGLASTFVLGFLKNPLATDEHLAQMAAANGEPVTTQAISQRYHPRLVQFLRTLFELAVAERVASANLFGPLLARFTDIQILDSTTITLPEELASEFPGCGGSHGGEAAMKLQVRLSLKTGAIDTVAIEAGRDCDVKTPLQQDVPLAGSLRITDLGYFDGKTFDLIEEAKAYWLSPWRTGVLLHDDQGQRLELIDWLKKQGPVYDGWVRIGAKKRRCRLIAWRLPPEVAARRRNKVIESAKKKGKPLSPARLAKCDWAILLTNLPLDQLSIDEAQVLYRSRWQIELLFKRWKSQGRIEELTGSTVVRCMVQLWSRLLAAILQQWIQCGVWGRAEISLKKVWDLVSGWANTLAGIWHDEESLISQLKRILATIDCTARQNKRKFRSSFEMLADPSKLRYPVKAPAIA